VARLDRQDELEATGAIRSFSKGKNAWRADFESDIVSGGGGLFSETLEETRRVLPVAGIGYASDPEALAPHYARPTMCSPTPTFKRASRTFALAHGLETPADVM